MTDLLSLGTRIRFISAVNGAEFAGVICGYPGEEDTYDVAHGRTIYRMHKDEFTVVDSPALLDRLWQSSTGLLDRFDARPSIKQAIDRMMSEVLELVIAAHDPYGASNDEIAKEGADVCVTVINVLRAAGIEQAQFEAAIESVMASNDKKNHETHQRSPQHGVERIGTAVKS